MPRARLDPVAPGSQSRVAIVTALLALAMAAHDEPGAPPRLPHGLLIALMLAGALVLIPFWSWLVLAVWIGNFGRRLLPRLTRWTGGRQRAAAIVTGGLITLLVVPVGLVLFTLVGDAIELGRRLADSPEATSMFEQLVTKGASEGGDSSGEGADSNPFQLLMAHGDRAWGVIRMVLGVAAKVAIGLFVFLSATYAVLADGPRGYRWFEAHLPLDPRVTRRLADAFTETGRGLVIGVGGAGLAQSVVATVMYIILGVPEPLVLGLLTLLASIIPSVGTAMVWGPVAIGLALTGRTQAAIILAVVGVVIVGSIDNVLRPILSRRGKLALPSILIMVGMFGGLALVGASGVILGPLVLRLAKEAMVIAREARAAAKPAG